MRKLRPAVVLEIWLSRKVRRKLAYGAKGLPFVTRVVGQDGPTEIPVFVLLTVYVEVVDMVVGYVVHIVFVVDSVPEIDVTVRLEVSEVDTVLV